MWTPKPCPCKGLCTQNIHCRPYLLFLYYGRCIFARKLRKLASRFCDHRTTTSFKIQPVREYSYWAKQKKVADAQQWRCKLKVYWSQSVWHTAVQNVARDFAETPSGHFLPLCAGVCNARCAGNVEPSLSYIVRMLSRLQHACEKSHLEVIDLFAQFEHLTGLTVDVAQAVRYPAPSESAYLLTLQQSQPATSRINDINLRFIKPEEVDTLFRSMTSTYISSQCQELSPEHVKEMCDCVVRERCPAVPRPSSVYRSREDTNVRRLCDPIPLWQLLPNAVLSTDCYARRPTTLVLWVCERVLQRVSACEYTSQDKVNCLSAVYAAANTNIFSSRKA